MDKKFPFPTSTVNQLINTLENIPPEGITSDELCEKMKCTKKDLSKVIPFLRYLNLIDIKEGKIILTEIGKEFLDAPEKDRPKIFRKALLNSVFKELLKLLDGKEFTLSELAHFFKNKLKSKGNLAVLKGYAVKLQTWLDYAGIATKKRIGREVKRFFSLKEKEEEVPKEEKVEAKEKFDNKFFYELGKLIGYIYAKSEKEPFLLSQIDKLAELSKEIDKEGIIAELLNVHKELFKELREPRIFIADIQLLEKKIQSSLK